ncbi:MAG: thiol-disulfide oxidoreductase DCC family protein [Gemmataceae bacterium]
MTTTSERPQSKIETRDPGRAIVLYDGACPFCRKSIALLKRLDWFDMLRYVDARDSKERETAGVLIDEDQLLEQMHVVPPNRKQTYAGFEALRWIAWRLPLLAPFAPLMYIPGIPILGQKVYLWIAKNRFQLVPCDKDGCAVDLVAMAKRFKESKQTT